MGVFGPCDGSAECDARHARGENRRDVSGFDAADGDDGQADVRPAHPREDVAVALRAEQGREVPFGRRITERTEPM